MAKRVLFNKKDDRELFTEFKPLNADFLKSAPDMFNTDRNDHATLALNPTHFMFFDQGQPYMYYRHSNPASTRFVGIAKLGDGPLDYQKGGYTYQLAAPHRNDPVVPYAKLGDDPLCYGYSSEDGKMQIRYYEDHIEVKESDILSYSAEYFPMAFVDHGNIWYGQSVYYLSGFAKGTFNGRPVEGICRADRAFVGQKYKEKGFFFDFEGLNLNHELAGIREDGRREDCVVDILTKDKAWAYYWLEGEEPIATNEVEVEADWYRVPYLDDGTCMFKEITFRFAGKEIHVNGKWGTKGWTGYPKFDKPGQVQVCGPWYEGKTPYNHKYYFSFTEVQESYDHYIKELGFDIVEE
ncbi:MAG: hypothetical protein IJ115_01775 [Erysipelotrichaceae bacterium]|nr:hypothetical protein [Erysipelotrichaceae bacterium]